MYTCRVSRTMVNSLPFAGRFAGQMSWADAPSLSGNEVAAGTEREEFPYPIAWDERYFFLHNLVDVYIFFMVNVGKYTIDIYIYIYMELHGCYFRIYQIYTKNLLYQIYIVPNIYQIYLYTKNIPYICYTHPSTVYYQNNIPALILGLVACRHENRSRQGWSPPGVSQHRQLGSTQGAFAQADGMYVGTTGGWLVGLGWVWVGWWSAPFGGWLSVRKSISFKHWDFGTMYVKNDEVINVCSTDQIMNSNHQQLNSSNIIKWLVLHSHWRFIMKRNSWDT